MSCPDYDLGVEIDLRASNAPLQVWIEPWGDEVTVPIEMSIRLVLDGDLIESLALDSLESHVLRLSVPRYGKLTILSERGERLGTYDTADLPPVPEGLRP